jgi:hypothetical protein
MTLWRQDTAGTRQLRRGHRLFNVEWLWLERAAALHDSCFAHQFFHVVEFHRDEIG